MNFSSKKETYEQPLVAWPEAKNLRYTFSFCVLFALTFCLVYGGTDFLTRLHNFRLRVHFNFERSVPFIPELAAVYLSINGMFLLAPFILRTRSAFLPVFLTAMVETFVGGFCFLLLPVEGVFSDAMVKGFWGDLFHLADWMNLDYNYVPSLHVTYSYTMALAFARYCGWVGRLFFFTWATVIALSTLFLHQHYLMDVIAGIVLAIAAMQYLYPRVCQESFLKAVQIEMVCLREFWFFIRRHIRYLFIFVAIYRYSLFRWHKTQIIRAGFCLAQHVDDVLDGDRNVEKRPGSYVQELIRQINTSDYDSSWPLAHLAEWVMTELNRYRTETDDPRSDLLKLFEVMLYDRQRIDKNLLLSGDELAEHHYKTFHFSLNIMLIMIQAELRAKDTIDLIGALSWCSPMRDLKEDLEKGLVNIPRPVLEESWKQGAKRLNYHSLIATLAIKKWIRSEYQRGKWYVDAFSEKLEGLKEKRGAEVLGLLWKAIKQHTEKFERKNLN